MLQHTQWWTLLNLLFSGAAEPLHSCHCCTAPEPSEAEFSAAKAEAVQGLQIAIENINDVLEEMKYAKEEFEE